MKKSKQSGIGSGSGGTTNNTSSSTSFIISKFIKYYWVNIIIFATLILILVFNLISVIMETKDHFDINRLLSELKNNSFVSTSVLLPNISSISSRQRISLISNTLILVIDFILFIFLCSLILKRNFLSSSSSNRSSNSSNSGGGILDTGSSENNDGERERLIIPSPISTSVTYLNNSTNSNFINNGGNLPTSYNSLGHGSNGSSSSGGHSFFSLHNNNNNHNNHHFDKGIVFCESSLYEPWNEITIEKIAGSSDDIKAMEKIRNTYYRYGITAAKLVYDRCIFFLTNDEKKEILRLFGLIDPTILKK